MNDALSRSIQCPSCWEWIEVIIDPSIEEQVYTEDCSVCCRPIVIHVLHPGSGQERIEARSEDD